MTDYEALLAGCEDLPDPVLFGVIADLCREQGNDLIADAWDWMHRHKKWPLKISNHQTLPGWQRIGKGSVEYRWISEWKDELGPFHHHSLPPALSWNDTTTPHAIRIESSFHNAVIWLATRLMQTKNML